MTKKSVTGDKATKKSLTTDEFLRALECTNPFSKNRVSGAADFEADVPTIHGDEFKKLRRRVERLGTGGASSGLLILGAAGVGKSHLLGRLARWADDGGATVLFLHNIVASPERLPRYLLRASVSVLAGMRPEAYGRSKLHLLLRRAILNRVRKKAGAAARMPPIDVAARTLDAVVREVDDRGDVARALVTFYRSGREDGGEAAGERARAAVQWLSGESIAKDTAESLELVDVEDDGAALADDAAVELVFRVLAHLGATGGDPLVLCVDQVDNLDTEKVKALCAFLQVLLDHADRMLVITSGIKQSMLSFHSEGVISEATWDRIAQHRLELVKIDDGDARALIVARIEQFAAPFDGLATVNVKRRSDELFPLDEAWLKNQLAMQAEFRPRDVITWARDRWEQQQERLEEVDGKQWMRSWPGTPRHVVPEPVGTLEEAIDAVTAVKLVERVNERILQPSALPPDADNLATLTASLLEHCCGREAYSIVEAKRCVRVGGKPVPAHDLLVQERQPGGSKVTTGVLFVSSDNATRVTHALKRLLEVSKPPDHRILVTDEERRPLRPGPKGQQHLQALKKLGKEAFHQSALTLEGHATLDALHGLIASARVGDLEVEYPRGRPRPISEAEAIESLHRQHKFTEQPLLRELLTEELIIVWPDHGVAVDAKRAQETIAAHLSWRLCLTSHEIAREFIEVEHLESAEFEAIHGQIKHVAESMHAQGFLHATAVNEYLYLQLMPKGQPAQWT
jgi:hypothetical protein